jgi:hypothetical protein
MSDREQNRLVTWKEIAAFLSCDVRTCLRWEKERGLPVHRPEGGSKSRVYAYKDELETWLKGNTALPLSPSAHPSRSGINRIAPAAAVILFIAAALFFQGSKLMILNRAGRHLWEHDTGLKNLEAEAKFRAFFNEKKLGTDSITRELPLIIIRDIDADGKTEVLFTTQTIDSFYAGRLTCFDHRGRERWRFEAGREFAFGGKTFSRDYWCRFDVRDLDADGRQEVVVIGAQAPDWPTQLAVLSSDGKLLGEYWNSGRILDYLSADLNGDGKKELAVCGTNNEYGRGFIAVFDPGKVGGASPNTGEYHSPDLAAGTEKAYILLPWTDIDPVSQTLNWAVNIELQHRGTIYILTLANVIYFEIDPKSLECRSANFSNTFRVLHQEAVKAGRVSSVLNDAYLENLRTSLKYWTGSGWTTIPTWIR